MAKVLDTLSGFWQARQALAVIRDPVRFWSESRPLPRCILSQKAEFERWHDDETVRINHEINFALNVYERRYLTWRDNESSDQRTRRLANWFQVVHLPFKRGWFPPFRPGERLEENPFVRSEPGPGLHFNLNTCMYHIEEYEEDFSWLAQRDLKLLELAWDRRKKNIFENPVQFMGGENRHLPPLPWDPPPDHWTWWVERPKGPFDAFGRALDGFYHVIDPSVSDLIKKDEQHLYSLLVDTKAEETEFFKKLVDTINDRLLIEPGPWVAMFRHLRSDAIDAVERWLDEYPTASESGLWFPRLGGSDDGERLFGSHDQGRLRAKARFCELTGREAWRIVERECPCGERMLFEVLPEGGWNPTFCPECGSPRGPSTGS